MTKHYKKSVPMLVQKHLQPSHETKQYACVLAFTNGVAEQSHYDTILFESNLLLVAGQTDKNKKYAVTFIQDEVQPALRSMKERVYKTGKFGVNYDELMAIKRLIDFSREFWKKQTGQLYSFCVEQINLFYADCERKRNDNSTRQI